MTAPVGPTGCTGDAEGPRPFTLGLGYGFSDTRLVFFDHGHFRTRQWATTLSFLAMTKGGTVVGGSIGALLGGRIDQLAGEPASHWTIEPGVVWGLTVARRFFAKRPTIPFLLVVGTLGGSSTRTTEWATGATAGLHAFDIKGDVSVGWTIGEAFSPYLAVRAFGGPVLWRLDDEAVFGTDLYHVTVATGFSLNLDDRFGLYFDGAFLGARGLSGGASVRF